MTPADIARLTRFRGRVIDRIDVLPMMEATTISPAQPDYSLAEHCYDAHSPAEIAEWWCEDDGSGHVHNAIDHILAVQRERFMRDHHAMVFGA